MTKILATLATLAALTALKPTAARAQSEPSRTKIELTVTQGGKTIVTELNSLSFSLSRNLDDADTAKMTDSARKVAAYYRQASTLLNMELKRVPDDLLRVFSKRQSQFDGSITIVDTYGKIPTRTVTFKRALLYNYADQFSSSGYGDYYGSSSASIGCEGVSINGIPLE